MTTSPSPTPTRIDPATRMGRVHYTAADLDRQIAFYRDRLGFQLLWRDGDTAALGTAQRELLRLTQLPGARAVRRTTGLYHTAFLVPTRWELAQLIRRIAETRTPIQGHSNHGTHLALYLPDAEGNGIELAWDFPRDVWPMRNGQLYPDGMTRAGIDIDDLFTELERDQRPWEGLSAETVVGHVHLHTSTLDSAQTFYHNILGFDVTMRSEEFAAVFVSAGGYHHHLGLNVWNGVGAPPAPPGSIGLRYFTVILPDEAALQSVVGRLDAAHHTLVRVDDGISVTDPAGVSVLLTTQEK